MEKVIGKKNIIYQLETLVDVKRYSTSRKQDTSETHLSDTYACRFYIGMELLLICGQYRLFLYKRTQETPNLIDYLYKTKRVAGVYITKVPIKSIKNPRSETKIDHVIRITFTKNQIAPLGNKYIIIVDNEHDFIEWVDNKIKSENVIKSNGEIEERIRKEILNTLAKDSSLSSQVHPSYIEEICDNLVNAIQTDMINNFFDMYIQESIQKQMIKISKPQFTRIMNTRITKYGSVFDERGFNIEKLRILIKEYNLNTDYIEKIISDDYHWYILNEAIDTLKSNPQFEEWRKDTDKITNEVYILCRKILAFENKYYREEMDINKII